MGKKKKKVQKPWCYYCDREFEDEKVLIQHQKARHFKCHFCHKKLSTAGGLVVHVLQVHKETISEVPFAKPGRESADIEIFGMDGVPAEAFAEHNGEDDEAPAKQARVEPHAEATRTSGSSSQTLLGVPGFSQPLPSAPWRPAVPTHQPYPQTGPAPMWPARPPVTQQISQPFPLQAQPSSSLFPGQILPAPPFLSGQSGTFPGTLQSRGPAPPTAPQRPLFPIGPPPVSPAPPATPFSATVPLPVSAMAGPPSVVPLRPSASPYSRDPAITSSAPSSAPGAIPAAHSAMPHRLPGNTGSGSVAPAAEGSAQPPPPPLLPAQPPPPTMPFGGPTASLSAPTEVYLVWDDELSSMEERRLSLPRYQLRPAERGADSEESAARAAFTQGGAGGPASQR